MLGTLTYSGEGHKSLDEKAGGWGELVGFLNQDIKAHLGKRKQKTAWCYSHLWEEGADGGRGKGEQRRRGTTFPCSCTPGPSLQSSGVAI